jgi:hypothetical protein
VRLTADFRLPLPARFARDFTYAAMHEGLRRKAGYALMCLVVFEASLFGSGQMLRLGPVTFKMILFALAVGYIFTSLADGDSLSYGSVGLISSLLVVLSAATLLGLVGHGREEFIYEDVTPLLYVLILPFFELTIRSREDLESAIRIIIFSSMVMSFAGMIMLAALGTGMLSPIDLYTAFLRIRGGDFMYDGLTWRIFYKGSLYIGMAVLILAFRKGLWARIGLFVTFVSLVLTVTRGFILALLFIGLIYAVVRRGRPLAKLAWGMLILAISSVAVYVTLGLAGDKTESDTVRRVTAHQVLERTDFVTAIIGHGFGVGVPERPEHMEIAYMEIFYKQGMLGLGWYGLLAVVAAFRFRRAFAAGNSIAAYPLLLTVVFVFVESLTNPFIDNPIGLSAILISLAGLRVLARNTSAQESAGGIAANV